MLLDLVTKPDTPTSTAIIFREFQLLMSYLNLGCYGNRHGNGFWYIYPHCPGSVVRIEVTVRSDTNDDDPSPVGLSAEKKC